MVPTVQGFYKDKVIIAFVVPCRWEVGDTNDCALVVINQFFLKLYITFICDICELTAPKQISKFQDLFYLNLYHFDKNCIFNLF